MNSFSKPLHVSGTHGECRARVMRGGPFPARVRVMTRAARPGS